MHLDLFTNDIDFLKIIKKKYKIINLFTENDLLFKIENFKNLKIFKVKNFKKTSNYYTDTSFALSYNFGKIIPEKLLNSYKSGVWNIHSGDLPKYRGRHPITAAFLNNERKIGISIHSMNKNIDMGILLSKAFISRNYLDDENTIKRKIIKKIPSLLSLAFRNKKKK